MLLEMDSQHPQHVDSESLSDSRMLRLLTPDIAQMHLQMSAAASAEA